ncbi:alpha/beta fold hydrolase [Kribbella sandramycini]|uniref:Alpha/beta fold hydrolase n=1 Tax=Kribbella sandramycini TaxID=60450 RepID=A0A7Y4NZ08_9ACTN|nr:alpha/beta hydrolase [Kribbella sandramycini]MBB6569820.1 pimeloyl-ACP methyl ester carboxylesterase [Kribbella sandramycini]NOL40353.1 alpha/beta fold hydrolase [Kribbella sandramycini]
MRKTLSLGIALATLATATIPGTSQAEPPPRKDNLDWGACPADVSPGVPVPPGLQCATIDVPLDYRTPGGRTIEIAISRLPSTKPEQRRGILLTNPGGPSSGLGYPATLVAAKLPQSVRDAYDVIGFDPRGIGRSTPVSCELTAEQQRYGNIPPYARSAADVTKRAGEVQQIAAQCAASPTAGVMRHISTANTARDLDRIRAALGEPKASYLGASWGTHLGALFTTLFPERSDRVVLDSNLGAGGWDYPSERLWGQGVEDRFPDFAAYAAANHREYGLGRTPGQIKAKYFELAAKLDKKPVGELDGTIFRLLLFAYSYGPTQLAPLAQLWKAVDTDQPLPPIEGTAAVAKADGADNLVSGRYAMICNDSRWPTTVRAYQQKVAVDRVRYPLFGAAAANIQPCAFWADPTEPAVRITDEGPSNVLMVQNDRDPATPLAGAKALRKAFGDRAVMVTADQGGHGTYLFGRNQCANYPVTTFLTTGERPAHDYACSAAAAPQ